MSLLAYTYRRDDAYFETAHQGRKPPTEILQKAELTGGDSCDKDERWANVIFFRDLFRNIQCLFATNDQHGNLLKGNGDNS